MQTISLLCPHCEQTFDIGVWLEEADYEDGYVLSPAHMEHEPLFEECPVCKVVFNDDTEAKLLADIKDQLRHFDYKKAEREDRDDALLQRHGM